MNFQERLLSRLPAGVRTHPLEASISLFGMPTGVSILLRISESNALNVLPGPVLTVWSIVWTLGCLGWFVGLVFSTENREGNGILITHVPILVLGLWFVSVSALVYGVAILFASGMAGLLAAVAPLCIAGGSYIRRVDLQRRIKGDRDCPGSTEP